MWDTEFQMNALPTIHFGHGSFGTSSRKIHILSWLAYKSQNLTVTIDSILSRFPERLIYGTDL